MRKVLLLEVLLEIFYGFFFKNFPLFTLTVLDASSVMLLLFRYFVLEAELLLLIFTILQNCIYFRFGQLASLCLVHGGAAICFFSFSIFISL